ncbi:MAG: c-type cytochrome [Cyclobacteriaceae bacterium]
MDKDKILLTQLSTLLNITLLVTIGIFILLIALHFGTFTPSEKIVSLPNDKKEISPYWQAPSLTAIPHNEEGDLIRYGRELIMHTSVYLGPKGTVKPISNGMNCRNCHLDGGTKAFGINYAAVASSYPKLRERSGTMVDVAERVNECIERSLNGTRLNDDDKELEAMVAYLKWIGKDVPKGTVPKGTGMKKIAFLTRPADPDLGKIAFDKHCIECHGANSEGEMEPNGKEWLYPPLFGEHTYNMGAGLYRLSKFASFVKYNMPFGTTHDAPVLTDEEAWDVAAYVNSLPHPAKDISIDWPDISKKPIDHPFGPFADGWSEERHKYGPFVD